MTEVTRNPPANRRRQQSFSSFLRGATSVVLLAVVAIFTLQNLGPVEIHFLDWTMQSRRVVVIGGSFLIGVAVGLLLGWRRS